MSRLRRDWTAAIAAHDQAPCRVCLRWPGELAHVIPRQFDPRARGVAKVHPLAVVPLCREHHQLYDSHRLDLLPHLTEAEVRHAVDRGR